MKTRAAGKRRALVKTVEAKKERGGSREERTSHHIPLSLLLEDVLVH